MDWESEIEKKIQEAIKAGSFDFLPGKGKPLPLEQNPYEDPAWRVAFHLLKANNFSLPWIERRREIEEMIRSARDNLLSVWKVSAPGRVKGGADGDWERAVAEFRIEAAEINRQILAYNLQIPSDRFQLFAIRPDEVIRSVQEFRASSGESAGNELPPLQS